VEIPDPDKIIENILKSIFGSGSVIVTVYLLFKALQSWWEAGLKTIERTQAVIGGTSRAYTRLRRMPSPARTPVWRCLLLSSNTAVLGTPSAIPSCG
jgi:hypothetical protein